MEKRMAISSAQLWQRISQWNLASASQCRRWAADIAQDLGPTGINDPQKILAQLVRTKRLTTLQANSLWEENPRTIVFRDYRALEWSTSNLFEGWIDAQNSQDQPALLYLIDPVAFQTNPAWGANPPSLALAKQHAKVRSRYLLPILELIVQPPAAALLIPSLNLRPIRETLFSRPLSPSEASQIVVKVASALEQLHDSKLVHGRITSASLVTDDEGEVVVLRDPIFLSSPVDSPRPSIFAHLSQAPALDLHYAAPEYLVPGQRPTRATDLYALGCLWYEFLTGNPPFASVPAENRLAAHASQPIDARKLGSLPKEHLACLHYLCAKNPTARFASATELIQALKTANPELASVLQPMPKVVVPPAVPAVVQPTVKTVAKVAEPEVAKTIATATSKELKGPVKASKAPAAIENPAPKLAKPEVVAAKIVAAGSSAELAGVKTTPLPTNPPPDSPKPKTASSAPPVPPLPPTKVDQQVTIQATPVQTNVVQTTNVETPVVNSTSTQQVKSPIQAPAVAPTVTPTSSNPPSVVVPTVEQRPKSKTKGKGTKTEGKGTKKKSKKKQAKRPAWVLPVFGGVAFLGMIGLAIVLSSGGGGKPKPTKTVAENNDKNGDASETPAEVIPVDPMTEQFAVQSDDGRLLWAPPHPNQPYTLELLPPGAQGFIFFRPDPWFISDTGKGLLEILDEPFKKPFEQLKKGCGVDLNDLSEIAIGIYSGTNEPSIVVRARAKNSKKKSELERGWGAVRELKLGEEKLWVGPERTYFVKAESPTTPDDIIAFSFGPESLMKELAELHGAAGPLRRQMEIVMKSSDAKSDLTIVIAPGFLFSPELSSYFKSVPRFQEPLRKMLGRDAQAALFTTTLEPQWYSELRVMATAEQDAGKLQQSITTAFKTMTNAVEEELISTPAHPYWRDIAKRWPQMLRAFEKRQRFAIENGQMVTNSYLPSIAAPNLLFATWMFGQNLEGSGASVAKTPPTTTPPSKSMTVDEILARPVDVVFDQQSLETAMNSILDEINNGLPEGVNRIRMEIDGGAFEKDGITRNKEVRNFNFKQQPGRAVLIDLIKKANPESVPELTNPAQKVVFVVLDDPKNPGKSLIQITTRKAVEAGKLTLPKDFVAQ